VTGIGNKNQPLKCRDTLKNIQMKIIFSVIVILFISCNSEEKLVKIKGNIKGSSLRKVYLTDAYYWDKYLDSSEIINGHFEFKQPAIDSVNLYSIKYLDDTGRIFSLELINTVLSPDSLKYLINAFIIDTTEISIYGDWAKHKNHYYEIKAGNETRALFRTQMMQFGYLSTDVSSRNKQLKEYIEIMRTYPDSKYLLTHINANKAVLNKLELQLLLNECSDALLNSPLGKKLLDYNSKKQDAIKLDNTVLEDMDGKPQHVYDTTAKVNMLVFWASWCGPCRQEIPALKEINKLYADKGLSITSISIDEDRNKWSNAVNEEKMTWPQLIVPIEKMTTFKSTFEVGAIPYVVFLDGQGKLITRSIGVDVNTIEEYKSIIKKYL
jgi:thiol-disulfide isomerase/thioredoxin